MARSFWISSMLSPGTRRPTRPRYISGGCDPYMPGPSQNTIVNSSDDAIPYIYTIYRYYLLLLHISRSTPTWRLRVYIYNCSSSTTFVFSILKCDLALLWRTRNDPVALGKDEKKERNRCIEFALLGPVAISNPYLWTLVRLIPIITTLLLFFWSFFTPVKFSYFRFSLDFVR
jgi:hypothetical protein